MRFFRFILPVMGAMGNFFVFATMLGKEGEGLGSSLESSGFAASVAVWDLVVSDHEQQLVV